LSWRWRWLGCCCAGCGHPGWRHSCKEQCRPLRCHMPLHKCIAPPQEPPMYARVGIGALGAHPSQSPLQLQQLPQAGDASVQEVPKHVINASILGWGEEGEQGIAPEGQGEAPGTRGERRSGNVGSRRQQGKRGVEAVEEGGQRGRAIARGCAGGEVQEAGGGDGAKEGASQADPERRGIRGGDEAGRPAGMARRDVLVKGKGAKAAITGAAKQVGVGEASKAAAAGLGAKGAVNKASSDGGKAAGDGWRRGAKEFGQEEELGDAITGAGEAATKDRQTKAGNAGIAAFHAGQTGGPRSGNNIRRRRAIGKGDTQGSGVANKRDVAAGSNRGEVGGGGGRHITNKHETRFCGEALASCVAKKL
jgi:hypothetical protein